MSTLKVNALQDTSGNGFYPARHWVNLNGTGTVSIRDSGGSVSSVTDSGVGMYAVNVSIGSLNYAFSAEADYNSTHFDTNQTAANVDGTSTSKVSISTYGVWSGTRYDSYMVSLIIVKD